MGTNGVVISDGTLVDVGDAVGQATGLGELLHKLLDALGALGYLLDELHVAGAETAGLVFVEDALHALHVLDELALVVGGDGYDVVHGEVAQHARLYLHGLDIHLPFHLVAGYELLAVHHLHALEHVDGGLVEVVLDDDGARLLDVEAPVSSLLHPLVAVSVAVEAYGLAGLDVVAQHVDDGVVLGRVVGAEGVFGTYGILGHALVDTTLERCECLGHSGIKGYHRRSAVDAGAGSAELEAVAGECKGRGAVAVGIVDDNVGYLWDVDFPFEI